MRNIRNFTLYICTFCIISGLVNSGLTQVREKRIHDRGMLHETVFNTGTIGRPYQYGDAGNLTTDPLMEWPSRSKTVIDGIEYSGQHNIVGGGMYVSANPDRTTRP